MAATTSKQSGPDPERGSPTDSNCILELAGDLIQSIGADGRILYANRAWREALGYKPDDLRALNIAHVIHPRDLAHCLEVASRVLAGETRGFVEASFVTKDGRVFPVEGSVSCLHTPNGQPCTIGVFRDATGRRAAEHALNASEEKYRTERDFNAAILDAAGNLLVVVDGRGRVLRFNRACEELSGYSRDDVQGRTFWEVLGWGDLQVAERLRDTFEGRGNVPLPSSWEDHWVVRDGTTRLISWSLSTLKSPSPSAQPEYFIASGVDITRSREQEEALRDSEERFRSAFDDAATGMALVRTDGHWLKVNRALCETVGYTEEELLTTDFQSLTHPDDLQTDVAHMQQLLSGKIRIYQTEKRYFHKDGHIVPVLLSVSAVRDRSGKPLYFLSQVQDITARRRAEDAQRLLVDAGTALAASIDYMQTLQNVAQLVVRSLADYCLIYVVEEDGRISRTAGAQSSSVQNRLQEDLLRYSPTAGVNDLVAKVIETGEPVLMVEVPRSVLEANAYDSAQLNVLLALNAGSCIVVPLAAPDGVIGAIVMALSGPERTYSGADLSLARDIARRAALALENARLFRQANEAIAGRDALLSVVSHDMTNYLMAISTFTKTLPDLVPGDDSPENRQLLEGLGHIGGAAQQMDRMVRDLLDFARVQAGRAISLDRRPVDLVALARQVAAEQHTTAKHTIVVSTHETALTGLWDEAKLARVLVNLLSNAVKYSPRGGEVLVTLAREEDAQGAWAIVSVRDRGVGIPKADLPNLFARFSRAGNVPDVSGAGLGLFSVHQIVQLHGGTVSVESEEGGGSVFTVRLPVDGS